MLTNPLPTIDAAFYMLIHQEREMMHDVDEEKVISNVTNEGYDKGKCKNYKGQGAGNNNNSGKNQNGKGGKVCTYCSKLGHIVDTCYQKHGYPPHYKKRFVNCTTSDDKD